jgi:ATP-dependent DNA ligase
MQILRAGAIATKAIWELKYDGFRCLATKHGKRTRLESHNGLELSGRFPELVHALRSIDADLVIDGELVVCDGYGRPVFERLKSQRGKAKAGEYR